MLVTLNRVLGYAEANQQAIGAFNVCTLEGLQHDHDHDDFGDYDDFDAFDYRDN